MKIKTVIALLILTNTIAKASEQPKVKVLAIPKDPTIETVLVGKVVVSKVEMKLELEPTEAMWTPDSSGSNLIEHAPDKADRYHIEFKPTDTVTKTRIPYSDVKFEATNKDNGKVMDVTLHPMWGSSGLHYSENSAFVGDGVYDVTVTLGVPTFAREPKDKDLWSKPINAKFHLKLDKGKLVEISDFSKS